MSGCPHPELTTYLRWLIWDQHALSPSDGVFYVLGMAVPFHPDQVAGRRNLPCKDKETKPRHCLVMQAQVQGSRICQLGGTPTPGPRGLSQHMCLPALKAPLSTVPTARQRLYRLPQAHTRCLRANLNMDFPRSQTKQAQTSTEWQLKAALPAGNWIFAAAESLLLPHPQRVHETNSFRSQLLVLSKQLTLFCSCPSVSILRSLKR